MAATPAQVLEDLKKGNYSPIYFLQGDEPFYIDQISDYIEDHAIDESQRGFNQMVMYGKDHDMNTIVLQAKRFPMMSERQVVIVKEAQEIKDLGREAGNKALLEYVKNPLPSTVLVFAHKNKSLDGRSALTKALKKQCIFIESKKLYENQVPNWISEFVAAKGHKIHPKAQALLVESAGTDLSKLSNEIQKILINFKEKIEITEDHVAKYVGVSKDYNVFELQKALGQKNILKANKIIAYFAKDPKGNPLIPIIALLYNYFVKVVLIHQSKDKSERAIADLLKVNPFFVKDYLSASRNYNLGKALNIVKFLYEADLRSKGIGSGSMTEEQILKELVFKILHV